MNHSTVAPVGGWLRRGCTYAQITFRTKRFRSVWQDYRGNAANDADALRVVTQAALTVPTYSGPRKVCVRMMDVFGFEAKVVTEIPCPLKPEYPMTKYIEIKTSGDAAKKNEWFAQCRQKNIPYVVVCLSGNTASVEWDYITSSIDSEKIFSENDDILTNEFKKIYSKYSTNISKFSISSSTVNFSKLSIENARIAANEIFYLINELIKKTSPSGSK